jgi:small neutral amino acid transporter SnatA (MarC family)
MENRQRRRITPTALIWGGIILCWAAFSGVLVFHHRKVDAGAAALFVSLIVVTIGAWIVRSIKAGHRDTQAKLLDAAEKTREQFRIATDQIVGRVRQPVVASPRWSTTYVPDPSLSPQRLAVMRDLTADHTGDIQAYRD